MPSPVPTFLVGTGEGTRLSAAAQRSVGSGFKPDPTERCAAATIPCLARPSPRFRLRLAHKSETCLTFGNDDTLIKLPLLLVPKLPRFSRSALRKSR